MKNYKEMNTTNSALMTVENKISNSSNLVKDKYLYIYIYIYIYILNKNKCLLSLYMTQ